MKILLINPPRVDGYPVVREERFEHKDFEMIQPPLNLLYCASNLLKHGFKVSFLDANGFNLNLNDVENKIKKEKPNIVVIRTGFDTFTTDIEVLKVAKKYKCITICRNKIISDVPWLRQELLSKVRSEVDIFVNDELDTNISRICQDILSKKDWSKIDSISFWKKDKLITTKKAPIFTDLDSLPFPAYHLLPSLKPYQTSFFPPIFTQVMSSRGCPNHCTFCAYAGMPYRVRSPENVIAELEWLKKEFGLKSFVFFDDTISVDMVRVKKLLNLMLDKKLNLHFGVCTRVNTVDQEMLNLFAKAGCKEISFGIETGNQKILDTIKKNITLEQIESAVKLSKKAGIKVIAPIIFGLPGETRKTIENTIKFVEKLNPYYCQYATLVPFPNTEAYRYFDKNKLILTKDWTKYNPLQVRPVMRTKALSSEEIMKLKKKAYLKFLLRPQFILSKLKADPIWLIKGFSMFTHRIIGLIGNDEYVR